MNRKTTRIAHWSIRFVAISLALLVFSITGVVAILTVAHASGQVQSIKNDVTPLPTDPPTPVPTDPPTPVPTNPPTPVPTNPPTPVPTHPPTPVPTPVSGRTPTPASNPTPVPTASNSNLTPIVGATATSMAIGGGNPKPTATAQKGTPNAKVTPTSMGTPSSTVQDTTSVGGNTTTSDQDHTTDNGMMGTMAAFTVPIIGASSIVILSTIGLIGLVVWRRRAAKSGLDAKEAMAVQTQAASVQAQGPWMDRLEVATPFGNYHAQPTELAQAAPAGNPVMIPFAMQGIAQYSPLLGAPNSSHLDAPAPPSTSDFRPLPIDYPQIIEPAFDREPPHTPPAHMIPPALYSAPAQTQFQPIRPEPPDIDEIPTTPPAMEAMQHPEPQSDPFLEAMMHQAQMGIFALPGKDN